MSSIAIIGCGQAGIALACHIAKIGADFILYYDNNHSRGIDILKKFGGVTLSGLYNDFVKISHISRNLKRIINECDILFLAAPTYAHDEIFDNLIMHLKPHHHLVSLTGNN